MSDTDPKPKGKKQAMAAALGYDRAGGSAPTVLASGRGAVAEQILQIAFANGIKVREDADLAQLLSAIDIDSEIPVEAFAAVAEILAYVYRATGATPSFTDEPPGSPDNKETTE